MDVFLENAQRIFDVARSDGSAEPSDFALLIRPDGGLHFVMDSPCMSDSTLDATAIHGGARIAYRVTRTQGGGVRVTGQNGHQACTLEQKSNHRWGGAEILRDRPVYLMTSPVTLSAGS